jgi:hypothetical protein
MQKFQLTIMSIFLILLSNISAQDSVLTALSFYPLDTGNYWEYKDSVNDYMIFPPQYSESFHSVKIIGDTILTNGIKYKIMERRNIPDTTPPYLYFERIDSSTANVYRYSHQSNATNFEVLIDSLMSNLGDTSRASRFGEGFDIPQTECISVDTIPVLGKETIVKSFFDHSVLHVPYYNLAIGFGYVGDSFCEMSCFNTDLVYAYINGEEFGTKITNVADEESIPVKSYQLYQNYPNPFNPETVITFYIPVTSMVDISIFDLNGRLTNKLVHKTFSKGIHSIKFVVNGLASGQYFYVLSSGKTIISRKLTIIK